MIFAGFRLNISKTSFVLIVFAVVKILLSSVLRLMVILLPDPVYRTEYMAEPFATVLIGVLFVIVGLLKTEIAISLDFNVDCIGNAFAAAADDADVDEEATDVTQIGWADDV